MIESEKPNALPWKLRHPWAVAGGEPRHRLPDWAIALMSEAADAIEALGAGMPKP